MSYSDKIAVDWKSKRSAGGALITAGPLDYLVNYTIYEVTEHIYFYTFNKLYVNFVFAYQQRRGELGDRKQEDNYQ